MPKNINKTKTTGCNRKKKVLFFFLQWISAAILIMHLLNQYIIRPLYFIVIFVNVNIWS